MTLAARIRLGPYEISSPLGAGGMGEVYRARDSRFEKEARAASALNHPNVVTIYDIGFDGAVPWLAMEFVDGVTLRELIERGSVSLRKLLEISSQIGDGLPSHLVGSAPGRRTALGVCAAERKYGRRSWRSLGQPAPPAVPA